MAIPMNKITTYYDILKVSRDAPDCVIKAARKALYQTHHPDKFQDDEKPIAEEIIKNIQQAYLTLIDPVQRAEYDRWIVEHEFSQKPLFDNNANNANNANGNQESNPINNKKSTNGLTLIILYTITAVILTIYYLKDKNNESKSISQTSIGQNTNTNTDYSKIKNVKNIRSFDFMNHLYSGILVENVKLNNGIYHEYHEGKSINMSILKSIEYFDIEGDDIEEAFVRIGVYVSGSYGYGESYSIFSYKNGEVKEIFLTKHRYPDLAVINGKSLIIKAPFWKEGDPMCCASKTETSIYAWENGGVKRIHRTLENRLDN